jgi:hypothetical protein
MTVVRSSKKPGSGVAKRLVVYLGKAAYACLATPGARGDGVADGCDADLGGQAATEET